MKSVLFSAAAGACLLVTIAFAASPEQHRELTRQERARLEAARRNNDHDNDHKKLSRQERNRLEAARRNQGRDHDHDNNISDAEKARLKAAYRAGQRN